MSCPTNKTSIRRWPEKILQKTPGMYKLARILKEKEYSAKLERKRERWESDKDRKRKKGKP